MINDYRIPLSLTPRQFSDTVDDIDSKSKSGINVKLAMRVEHLEKTVQHLLNVLLREDT